MLFVCLSNPLPLSAIPKGVGGVELRLDLFTCIDMEWIQTFILNCSLPVMLTLRSLKHGG